MYSLAKKFFDFKRNFLGIISLSYIILVFFISVFAYVLAPDNSTNANTMNLSIHSKKPGFSTQMLVYKQADIKKFSFKSIFFGYKDQINQIPIIEYEIKDGDIHYVPHGSLQNEVKTINLNAFDIIDKKYYLISWNVYSLIFIKKHFKF